MDIEQFYDADERRRQSAEHEFGTEWRDAAGVRYELSWVEDTGELYVMREPAPPEWEDPFGGIHVDKAGDAPVAGMVVQVLGRIGRHDEVESVLDGWRDVVDRPDSVHWLAERLRERGVLTPPGPEPLPD